MPTAIEQPLEHVSNSSEKLLPKKRSKPSHNESRSIHGPVENDQRSESHSRRLSEDLNELQSFDPLHGRNCFAKRRRLDVKLDLMSQSALRSGMASLAVGMPPPSTAVQKLRSTGACPEGEPDQEKAVSVQDAAYTDPLINQYKEQSGDNSMSCSNSKSASHNIIKAQNDFTARQCDDSVMAKSVFDNN